MLCKSIMIITQNNYHDKCNTSPNYPIDSKNTEESKRCSVCLQTQPEVGDIERTRVEGEEKSATIGAGALVEG